MSPGSAPVTTARIARRSTFALRVFGSARREANLRGLERRTERRRRRASQISRAQRVVGTSAGREHDEHPERLALQLVGHADRGGLDAPRDARPPTVSTSAGPSRLPASLIVSSERPCRNHWPSSLTLAKSPCHHTSGQRDQYVVEIALADRGSRPRVMPGHGFVHTSSPTSPRTEWPSSSNTSTAMPERGTAERARRERLHDVRRQEARADLGAARDVDDRAPAARRRRRSTTATEPSFHGSPVDARMRSDERSWRVHRFVAVSHQRADERGRDAEHVDAVPLDERPEPVGTGIVGRAVVQHERAAVRERADDLPRPHDPADVGEPEQALARPEVDLERDLLGDLHEEAAVHVHRALGPAGRAARVRDEQRMFAVDGERVERSRPATSRERRRRACGIEHERDGARAGRPGPCARSAPGRRRRRRLPSSRRRLPRRVKAVGGDQRDRGRVREADRDCVGAVAARRSAGTPRRASRSRTAPRPSRGSSAGRGRPRRPRRRPAPRAPRRCGRSGRAARAHVKRACRAVFALPDRPRVRRVAAASRRTFVATLQRAAD